MNKYRLSDESLCAWLKCDSSPISPILECPYLADTNFNLIGPHILQVRDLFDKFLIQHSNVPSHDNIWTIWTHVLKLAAAGCNVFYVVLAGRTEQGRWDLLLSVASVHTHANPHACTEDWLKLFTRKEVKSDFNRFIVFVFFFLRIWSAVVLFSLSWWHDENKISCNLF